MYNFNSRIQEEVLMEPRNIDNDRKKPPVADFAPVDNGPDVVEYGGLVTVEVPDVVCISDAIRDML